MRREAKYTKTSDESLSTSTLNINAETVTVGVAIICDGGSGL